MAEPLVEEPDVTGVTLDMDPAMVLIAAYPDVDPAQICAILEVCQGDVGQAANLLADVAEPQTQTTRHQRQRRSPPREPQKQYSLIFPSCSPAVHSALDEIRTGSQSCARDSRIYLPEVSSPVMSSPAREELAKRKASREQLSGMLRDIVDVAQCAADESKQHVKDQTGRLKDGFALTSPVKLLAQIADRHRGTGLIPICLDEEAVDQLNLHALPFLLKTAPPFEFPASPPADIETPVGLMNVSISEFVGHIVYDHSQGHVMLDVNEEGIHIVLAGFGIHMPECTVKWEKLTFPKLADSAKVEVRVVDCLLEIVVSAAEVESQVDLARFLRAQSPNSSPKQGAANPSGSPVPRSPGRNNRNVTVTKRSLNIEPQQVKVGRLLTNVHDSCVSLAYNWVLTAFEKQLVELIEANVEETLNSMGESVGQNAEWIPVCVLAILKGTPTGSGAPADLNVADVERATQSENSVSKR